MRIARIAAAVAVAFGATAGTGRTPAEAGPPCICWPIDIGAAKSLPWGEGAMDPRTDYDLARLVPDTLAILDERASPLVRMETLRRAALYFMRRDRGSAGRAWELLGRVEARALTDEAAGKRSPLPWFDVTYLLATYRQAGIAGDWPSSAGWEAVFASRAAAGTAWAAAGYEMALGAALMNMMGEHADWKSHALLAIEGAGAGSLLEKNLLRLVGEEGDTLASLKARLSSPAEGATNR